MKIAVEGSVLVRSQRTGVDNYTHHLLQEAIKQMPDDTFWLTYMKFLTRGPVDSGIKGRNVRVREIVWLPGKVYNLLSRVSFAPPFDVLALIRPDIFFFPNFIRWPLWWTKRSVLVVYDLSFLHASKHAVPGHSQYLAKYVPRSIKKASQVVAISENTKREIMDEYGTDPAKISIIYPAVDHSFFKPAAEPEIEAVREKFGITKPYILSVGTIEPRKNLVGLLRAYDRLPDDLKSEYALVLTGGKGWLDDEIDKLYERLRAKYSVIRTGYVDDSDLPALYSGASVLAYPAFYEGFGMPPLEAMACGTPVVVGDNSSLPEVVGEAGIKVDARSTAGIAAALARVLSNKELADDMRKKGFEQAKKFNWTGEAAKLKEVFQKVGRTK